MLQKYFHPALSGADPAILKRGVPTICSHSNALIGQKKGGFQPPEPPPLPWICHCFFVGIWPKKCLKEQCSHTCYAPSFSEIIVRLKTCVLYTPI